MAYANTALNPMNTRGGRINFFAGFTNENYVTGGFAITPNMFGLGTIRGIQATAANFAQTGMYTVWYNATTSKLQLHWVDTTVDGAVMAEVPNATAIGATIFTGIAIGN